MVLISPGIDCMQVGYDRYHSITQRLAIGTQILVVVQIVRQGVTKPQRSSPLLHRHVLVVHLPAVGVHLVAARVGVCALYETGGHEERVVGVAVLDEFTALLR